MTEKELFKKLDRILFLTHLEIDKIITPKQKKELDKLNNEVNKRYA